MIDIAQLVGRYVATWNDTESAHRRAEIDAIWEPDGRYFDPVNAATGPDQIDAMISGFHRLHPGVTFRPAGPIDAHHELARFGWEFGPEAGEPIATGMDVIAHTANGRLATVYGFFDPAPS
ncbi:nuclear transport factor 2 family protein [Paractinoplanes lichenicola]|uniref:Nuclear transport factor 2 family protein n=1 Tax=Paractinoplanes lichenicola TaxID=2802976 RepID=A0ABS1VXW7_9ACTN|nr:nuclear transport factor 2 family protein [Actinoplanes lichenicola]MBL7259320.1 nuclear transport factor 2 family protein [Actinoplanes lichenicola]